jgi:hypothetical protein
MSRNMMNIEELLQDIDELEPQAQLERLQQIVDELEKLVNQ